MAGRLRIGNGLAGVHVLVDGRDVGVTPLSAPLPLPPGPHRVEFSGAPLSSQQVEIPSGQEVVLLPPNLLPPAAAPRRGRSIVPAIANRGRQAHRRGLYRSCARRRDDCRGDSAAARRWQVFGRHTAALPDWRSTLGMPVTRVIDGRSVGGPLLGVGIVAAVAGTVPLALPGPKRPLRASLSVSSGVELSLATAF